MDRAERIEFLARSTPWMAAYLNPEGRYEVVTRAYATHRNATPDSLVGRPFLEALDDRDLAAELAPRLERALGGRESCHERKVHLMGGEVRFTRTRFVPHLDGDDRLVGCGVHVRELTERQWSEEALRRSEERFRQLYNQTPVMMHSIDHQGRLVSVNETWLGRLGYPREDVIGRPITEFMAGESRRHAARVAIPELWRDGAVHDVEYEMVTRDGEVLDVLLSAVATGEDDDVQSMAFVVDVTERKRAQRALAESEERLSRIVHSAMDAIVILDEGFVIRLFNSAAEDVFRCPADQAVGTPFARFASSALVELVESSARAFARRASGSRYTWVPEGLTARRVDGSSFPIEATLSQFELQGETHYTLILRDVHHRVQAEEALQQLRSENRYLKEQSGALAGVEDVVGEAPAFRRVLTEVEKVAPTDATVLITGETGTGKEVIARAIRNLSSRRDRLFVAVNCAALPSGVIESELFGHERGAFTGATARKAGRFELADGGTIFLDEVGDLPLELQAKLLRVLQEGELERVGGTKTLKVDVRVIAATHRDLERAVQEERFRADLFYRLHVFPIRIPALRERVEDIPLLARHFILQFAAKTGRSIGPVADRQLAPLTRYAWPGNVRELQNVIERAVILSSDGELDLDDFTRSLPSAGETAEEPERDGFRTLEELERGYIEQVLASTGGKVSGPGGAAEILGLKRTTLEARMKRLGVTRPGR